ncbi:peptidase family C50-domain-containing protein [Hyaloraphidium curvatum]|nr:peptidase family C50-domain-containing protein [Hyaloraphidium curvatum]
MASPSPPSMSVRQAQLLEVYEREMNMKPSEFRAAYVETLPPHWTVCSLAVDEERDDLIVSRLRKGCDPVIMRLPLRRQAHRDNGSEDCLGYKAALAEFRSILSESDATLQQPPAGMARTDKVDWWNKRKELDGRMGSLVQQIESTWLGAFKSLLLPDSSWSTANSKIFRERLQSVLSKTLDGRTKSKGPMPDIHPAVSDILLRLGAEADDRDVEDFLYFVLESWQAVTGTIDLGEIDMDLDVMEKLLEQCNEDPSVPDEAHVVLIVDRTTNMLPWESLPAFREISMSRLPSLMLLRDLLLLEKQWAGDSIESGNRQSYTVSRTQCSYILNPGGDLASTQKRFETLFAQQQWRGIVGRPPTDSEMCGMLSDSDIFLYFGHNGGEQFVKGHEVRKLDRCAVALLVGCSSGKLKDLGEFEPMGTPVHYLMAGCPTILANLWEVTDKDIDAFAYRVLMDWGMLHEAKEAEQGDRASGAPWPSITACVAASRGECKLKYLNGAAPVVYGVPSYVKRS